MSSYEWETEAQQAYDAIEGLDDKTCDNVFRLVQKYGPLAVAAAAAAEAIGATPGGSSTLTDLTDVGGQPGPGKGPVGDPSGTDFTLQPVVTSADLDAILASVAAVTWRPLALGPGLTPFGQGFADPRYRLTLNNVVHVEGMVGCSPPLSEDDAGKVLATLDADSLPTDNLLFGCPAFGNNARLDVTADGSLVFQGMLMGGGQIDWVSLSSISYSVG